MSTCQDKAVETSEIVMYVKGLNSLSTNQWRIRYINQICSIYALATSTQE